MREWASMCDVPLSVKVKNILGEQLGTCGGPVLNRLALIGRHDRKRFPMLYGVDPYGQTCFNRLQAEMLADELATIRAETEDTSVAQLIAELEPLVLLAREGRHHTLTFIGD